MRCDTWFGAVIWCKWLQLWIIFSHATLKTPKKLRLWNAWFVMIKLFSVDFICYKYKPIHLFVSENYYIEKNKMNLWHHIIYKYSAGIMNEHRRRNPSFTGCQANSAALSKCTKRQIEWTNHTEKKTCPNNIKKQQMPQNKNRSPIKTQITRNKTKENFSHIHKTKKKPPYKYATVMLKLFISHLYL